MAYDIVSNATWSYASGTLRKLSAPTGEVTIDIAANPALHLALSAQQWKIDPTGLPLTLEEMKRDYNLIPAENWIERRIKWNRVTEDPPVLQIEQNIGAADYVDYNVYLLEDAPELSELIETLTNGFNILRARPVTKADTRAFLKVMVRIFQKTGLIDDDLGD
jgi:hypothetical protein